MALKGKDITLDELRAQGFIGFYVAIGCQGGKPHVEKTDGAFISKPPPLLQSIFK